MTNINCEHEKEHLAAAQRAKERAYSNFAVEKMCKIFHVLAEPSRLKIVLALMNGEMSVYHLTEVCGSTVSGVSHQLRIMRDNGIVQTRRFGKNVEYSIADDHVREMVAMALEHLHCSKE